MIKKIRINKNKKKRLVTAALPYINNIPHLGHIVGSHLPADIFARYSRTAGYDTIFVGGTDENGSTSEIAASKIGVDIKIFSNKLHEEHAKIYRWFGISYDIFSRTSKSIHYKTVQDFFKKIYNNGFIDEGMMKVFYSSEEDMFLPDRYIVGECPICGYKDANGDQCEKCTTILDPMQLINPRSNISGGKVEIKNSKHLFIRLDKLSPELEKWIKTQDKWRRPVINLAKSWIKEGLKPRAITRDLKHGVPVPLKGYKNKVFYVWFDAPIGYVSATKEITKNWKEFWGENSEIYNFLGKDNIPFHTIFWPAILIGQKEFNLPTNVIGLQYLNYEGGKFSKSKERGVFCEKLPNGQLNSDIWRAYLTQIIPETSDSEFKWGEFKERINSDIIGNLGNFVNRTISFVDSKLKKTVQKYKETSTKIDDEFKEIVKNKVKEITSNLESAEIRKGFSKILALSTEGNKYLTKTTPWKLLKTEPKRANEILSNCIGLVRTLAIIISPYLPLSSQKIWEQLNLTGKCNTPGNWNKAYDISISSKHKINKADKLFIMITEEDIEKIRKETSKPTNLPKLFN
ncbi:MAG: methionine--tRNA ligase [Nanoarchaeota archaeon]